jgi:hypothetical protein
LKPVEGRHVAVDGGNPPFVVFFKGNQIAVGNVSAVDGLVHRLRDDAVYHVGNPGGG